MGINTLGPQTFFIDVCLRPACKLAAAESGEQPPPASGRLKGQQALAPAPALKEAVGW